MNPFLKYIIIASVVFAVGCSSAVEPADQESQPAQTANLALTTDVLDDTDLGGVQFTVTQVDCATGAPTSPGYTETTTVDLADMYIPGGDGSIEESPYDANSQHLFADQYFDLQPGCYDVVVEPVQEDGSLSEDCWSAHQDGVEVFDGATTEILLIMQCRGEEPGGLDVIGSVNHPPRVGDLEFDPSKFMCEDDAEVCVTVSDPDSDPIDVQWLSPSSGAQVVSSTQQVNADGDLVTCATIEASTPGTYDLAVAAQDMGYNDAGDLVPIETLLAAQGDPHPSHAVLRFPVHVLSEDDCIDTCQCPDGFQVNPDGDSCVRTDTVSATYNGTTYDVCAGDQLGNYSAKGARYPGGTNETSPFWGQTWTTADGRLNDVGVWSCTTGDGGNSLPMNKWIGFSSCLEVPSAGDYIIGMGADNQIRFSIDGQQAFSKTGTSTENFTNWWMRPVSLTAGTHIIELEGYNNGDWASFGAEIYGPFPAGSLSTDAAMMAADKANNIIFSTGDQVGGSFTLGQNSGYSCPDGYAVNMCSGRPTCTRREEVKCR